MTVIRNWTGCAHFGNDARERLDRPIKTEEGLLKEITGEETGGKRKKRVFNFIGEVSKILFRTMDDDDDDDDAKYYNKLNYMSKIQRI